jgi:hypothetical protein
MSKWAYDELNRKHELLTFHYDILRNRLQDNKTTRKRDKGSMLNWRLTGRYALRGAS